MGGALTLREALQNHLAEEGFPADGGNSERWVPVRVGPLVVCLPNLPVRQKATLPHDLNHVVSGYGHDLLGEAEIGAWELGGGCGRYVAAWVLTASALIPGFAMAPRRMFAAFVRGRHTGNLLSRDYTELLDLPLDDVRTSLGLDRTYSSRFGDVAVFVLVLTGLCPVAALIAGTISLATSPAWIAEGAYRQRRSASPATE
jgi:hypothetical protein